jgi:hypothetical protein
MKLTEQDRKDLETYLGYELSEKRWHIVVSEIDAIEDDEEASDVLVDIITHFDDYEKEYDLWESK